ncbi:hypothetical protein HK101_010753 [Irineochytrium annulatum]|nr:hypothetical protein HK101_010753 [Irineochytrium annulatum]
MTVRHDTPLPVIRNGIPELPPGYVEDEYDRRRRLRREKAETKAEKASAEAVEEPKKAETDTKTQNASAETVDEPKEAKEASTETVTVPEQRVVNENASSKRAMASSNTVEKPRKAGRWTAEEDRILIDLAREKGKVSWKSHYENMGINRSLNAIVRRVSHLADNGMLNTAPEEESSLKSTKNEAESLQNSKRKAKKNKPSKSKSSKSASGHFWTAEQEELLLFLRSKGGATTAVSAASKDSKTTSTKSKKVAKKMLNASTSPNVEPNWTAEEDDLLISLKSDGDMSWADIENRLPEGATATGSSPRPEDASKASQSDSDKNTDGEAKRVDVSAEKLEAALRAFVAEIAK